MNTSRCFTVAFINSVSLFNLGFLHNARTTKKSTSFVTVSSCVACEYQTWDVRGKKKLP